MSQLPPAMKRNGRPVDPHFHRNEYLYRRVPLWLWDDSAQHIDVNAIELPDISVGRSKYAHPEWLRFAEGRFFEDWGVIGFQVRDIPPERWFHGVFQFEFRTMHMPEDSNYPHAEVQAYDQEQHLDLLELLPDEVHLEWRELLLRKVQVFLQPYQGAAIRQSPPVSHKPELPVPPAVTAA